MGMVYWLISRRFFGCFYHCPINKIGHGCIKSVYFYHTYGPKKAALSTNIQRCFFVLTLTVVKPFKRRDDDQRCDFR